MLPAIVGTPLGRRIGTPDVAAKIVSASRRLMVRFGYTKMTVEDIAHAAGIGKGTVYLHFSSKEEIALAVINGFVTQVFSELRRIAGSTELSVEERIRQMLVARVLKRLSLFRPFVTSLNDLLAAIRPALIAQRAQQLEDEAAIFAAVLRQGMASGKFRALPAETTAHAFLDATNSLLPYYLSPHELRASGPLHVRVLEVSALLLTGLAPSSRTEGHS